MISAFVFVFMIPYVAGNRFLVTAGGDAGCLLMLADSTDRAIAMVGGIFMMMEDRSN